MLMAAAKTRIQPPISLARRVMVGWRAGLAVVGGYAVGALLAAVLAVGLPRAGVTRFEASTWGTLAGLLLMPLAPVAAFGIRKTWLASAWMIGSGLLLTAVLVGLKV